MAKFCPKCGTPLAEDVKFCATCGTPAPIAEPVPEPAPQPVCQAPVEPQPVQPAPKKKGKGGLIVAIVAVIAALIVAAVLIPWGDLFGGSDDDSEGAAVAAADSPEAAVNLYYDTLYEGKSNALKSLAPQAFWDWAEDEYDVTAKDVVSFFKKEMKEDLVEEMADQYGKNYTVTFTTKEEHELVDEHLENIAEFLNDAYGIKKSSVTKAVQLDGVVEAKGSKGEDSDDMDELYAVQIDGKWYYCYINLDPEYCYVDFPLSGLVNMLAEEKGSYDDDDVPVQDDLDSDVPAPNPPVQNDEQQSDARREDPVQILQALWDSYVYANESFYTVGGDPENRVDDAAALHDTYYFENMIGTYKVPEVQLKHIDQMATLTDGQVANNFCSAVYLMDADMSDSEIEDFMNAMGQSLKNADWEGYEPERILVCRVEDQCVLVAFGQTNQIINFRNAAEDRYNIVLWFDMPLEV